MKVVRSEELHYIAKQPHKLHFHSLSLQIFLITANWIILYLVL